MSLVHMLLINNQVIYSDWRYGGWNSLTILKQIIITTISSKNKDIEFCELLEYLLQPLSWQQVTQKYSDFERSQFKLSHPKPLLSISSLKLQGLTPHSLFKLKPFWAVKIKNVNLMHKLINRSTLLVRILSVYCFEAWIETLIKIKVYDPFFLHYYILCLTYTVVQLKLYTV